MTEYNHNAPPPVLLKSAQVEGQPVDVLFSDVILDMGQLQPSAGVAVIDARQCALLPGLTDHHLHVRAYAALETSVDIGPAAVEGLPALRALLASQPGQGWIRCVGYHESTLGELTQAELAGFGRPIRIQHRSGKVWILNDVALAELGVEHSTERGVERDSLGLATGRLFRMDAWLDQRLARTTQNLQAVRDELARYGVTQLTDASHTNLRTDEAALKAALSPLQVNCMGADVNGNLKVMLDEDRLPDFSQLVQTIDHAHQQDRGVAFHCVSRVESIFAVAALREAGVAPTDRIEHGGMIPVTLIEELAELGLPVITQPGFIYSRGDQYLAAIPAQELADLYRYQSLLDGGVRVLASSDAPYGPLDPWRVMASAVQRHSSSGQPIGAGERVSADEALSGYLRPTPRAERRRLAIGAEADMCLLDRSWQRACEDLTAVCVQQTWRGGVPLL
ncbi:MAG: amidohydrolase family protein [Pseudomonadales bacterium]